jgi:glycosyltransferase involved in cell wall biosynthesis
MISIIVPANNEEGYIGPCLEFILKSRVPETGTEPVQVIVVANGCIDTTVTEARVLIPAFARKGWQLDVLDLEEGGKIHALNAGDRAAMHDKRVYIDADIHVTEGLIAQLAEALDQKPAAYASGRPQIRLAKSFFSERYARFWEKTPFMASGVPGCGVYSVNAAGRTRWDDFPDITADDIFVRCHFAPDEMHGVPATYSWPITEGFGNLVRVRRRQDQGLAQMHKQFSDLANGMERTAPDGAKTLRLLLQDPLGFVIYAVVALTVRLPLFLNRSEWDRGR